MEERRTFRRSWQLMTSEKGWIKLILVLTVSMLVPVAGVLGVEGYMYEWARLLAWGADSAPKRKDVHVGGLIGVGWRLFVVTLVWMLVWVVGFFLLAVLGVFGGPFLVLALLIAWYVALFFYLPLIMASNMRASIYTKISAGLNPSRALEMVRRDPKGIFKIMGLQALFVLVCVVVSTIVTMAEYAMVVPYLGLYGYGAAQVGDPNFIQELFFTLYPWAYAVAALFYLVAGVVSVAWALVTIGAVGLWVRQFNVAVWGGPNDPLPAATALPESIPAGPSVAPAPEASGASQNREAPAPVQPAQPVEQSAQTGQPVAPVQPDASTYQPASAPTHEVPPEKPAAPASAAAAEPSENPAASVVPMASVPVAPESAPAPADGMTIPVAPQDAAPASLPASQQAAQTSEDDDQGDETR